MRNVKKCLGMVVMIFVLSMCSKTKLLAADVLATGYCGDGVSFCITDDKVMTISGQGKMKDYVFTTDRPYLDFITYINCVVIEDGVESIGQYSFRGFDHLQSVEIPESVEVIGARAFEYCKTLESIEVPNSVKKMGEFVFNGCYDLEQANIPMNLQTVPVGMFSECHNLSTIEIPKSIEKIGGSAFYRCKSLQQVELPEILTYIGASAFRGCESLTEITIPEAVTEITVLAFAYDYNLEKVDLTEFTGTISEGAFSFCKRIQEVALNEKLQFNAEEIFEGTLWKLRKIGGTSWGQGDLLYKLDEEGTLTISGTGKVLSSYYAGYSGNAKEFFGIEKKVVMEDGIIEISGQAFEAHKNLERVEIPESVTCIDYAAFCNCVRLDQVTIPDSVTRFGSSISEFDNVFLGCTQLKSLSIPCRWEKKCPKVENLELRHSEETIEEVYPASMKANGSRKRLCEGCGKVMDQEVIYRVKKVALSQKEFTYDGKSKKPMVSVTDKMGDLVSADNYKVSYEKNRKKVGTYEVTVTFKEDYIGETKVAFKIIPQPTKISLVTGKSKSIAIKWSKKTKQVTGYEVMYSTSSGFKSGNKTVIIKNNKTTSKTIKNLKNKKKYYVKVRTYKKVSGVTYYSAWSDVKTIKTK